MPPSPEETLANIVGPMELVAMTVKAAKPRLQATRMMPLLMNAREVPMLIVKQPPPPDGVSWLEVV